MLPEELKLLVDIRDALEDIREFTAGMDFGAYKIDAKCRAAVERKFEIIGEACTRLRAATAHRVGSRQRVTCIA